MRWQNVALGEIFDFSNGVNFDKSAYGTGVKLIGVSNFGNRFSPDFDELQEIDEAVVRTNDYLSCGDIVFVRSNGNKELVGRCMLISEVISPVTYSGFCIRARMKNNRHDPRFFTYYFKTQRFRKAISGSAVGSNIQNLSQGRLVQHMACVPDLSVQRRIADILSAYDDLIENNQKQIKLLEEAAQRLYREWFVELRFPGHETTPVVDGVPEGWKRVPMGSIVDYEIGGGWGEDEPTAKAEIAAYVIRGTDIYGITHGEMMNIPHRYHPASNLSSRKLQPGDIVFEVSGGSRTEGVAKTLLITDAMLKSWDKPVMCASFCKLMRFPTQMVAQYIFDMLQYMRSIGKTEEFEKKSASSIINYRWKDFLEQLDVILPPIKLLQHYAEMAEGLYNAIVVCSKTIDAAKKARDRLLPKLMSGDVEV